MNQHTSVPWPQRFFNKIDKKNGPIISRKLGRCWLWTGCKARGYGMVRNPATHKMTTANRMAYVIANGSISPNLDAAHKCDVALCVRPSHLFAATALQNLADAVQKGRAGGAKLSPNEVKEIRRRLYRGENQIQIAEKFHVSPSNISKIHTVVSWRWLESNSLSETRMSRRAAWGKAATKERALRTRKSDSKAGLRQFILEAGNEHSGASEKIFPAKGNSYHEQSGF